MEKSEVYLEPSFFAKSFILDVGLGSKYDSAKSKPCSIPVQSQPLRLSRNVKEPKLYVLLSLNNYLTIRYRSFLLQ